MICSVCKKLIPYNHHAECEGVHWHPLKQYTLYTYSDGKVQVFLPNINFDTMGSRVLTMTLAGMPSLERIDRLLLLK